MDYNEVIKICIIVYPIIGLLLALLSLRLCVKRCGKKFLKKRAIGASFSNRTLVIVNNIWLWPLYFYSLLNELGIIHIPDWMSIIKD